jgi:NAD(P)-dependent dehydrogenase (short-subunit alcohol dehydrogenase family)
MSLENKVVAITGAARGIGRAAVKGFLDAGAKVVAIDLSWDASGFSGDRDDAFFQELKGRPDDVVMVTCDIGEPSQVQAAYDATMDKFQTVDFLWNNAGVRMRDLYPPAGRSVVTLETTRADWERMFGVTVFGAMDMTKLFIQPMLEKRAGSILTTISSGALHFSRGGAYFALRPNSREVPYQPAKAAILCAMFYLADEVAQHNIAVNIIIPGHTRTTGFDEQNAARRSLTAQQAGNPQQAANRGPLALLPDHMVPLAMFLADKDAESGVTGKCFDTMTWNIEHGLGGPNRWADLEAEPGVEEALQRMGAK